MASPLPLLPWVESRFFAITANGTEPNSGGLVYTFETDLVTPAATYTGNSTSDAAHTNPIELDSDGRPPSPIYINGAIAVDVRTADDVSLYTVDYVADVGALYAESYGALQAAGAKGITLPYTVQAADRSITIDDVGGGTGVLTLPDVTTWPFALYFVNESDSASGGKTVRLTPQAGQTVQSGIGGGYFSLSPASSLAKWAILLPDGDNDNWLVFSNQV